MPKSTLVIGGLDPTGGAGVSADARTLSLIGVHSLTVATCIVPQTERTLKCVYPLPREVLRSQIESAFESMRIDSCKISVVYSKESVHQIVDILKSHRRTRKFPIVFDPVMQATSGGDLCGDASESFRELLAICDVITPNLREAVLIAEALGVKGVTRSSIGIELTRFLDDSGLRTVVVTGGTDGKDTVYRRTDGSIKSTLLEGRPIPGKIHGSGCMHSSVIAGLLAKGYEIIPACMYAKSFVEETITRTLKDRQGTTHNMVPVIVCPELRYQYVEEVYASAMELCRVMPVECLPEVGTNIAYSLPAPEGIDDVCALSSRIVRWEGSLRTFGRAKFGVDSHMARLALALAERRFDTRSCCNIRYTPELVQAIKKVHMNPLELKRDREPKGVTTMEWLAEEITGQDEVPSFVYDRGMPGKEAMIRVIGSTPADVMKKVRMVFKAYEEL